MNQNIVSGGGGKEKKKTRARKPRTRTHTLGIAEDAAGKSEGVADLNRRIGQLEAENAMLKQQRDAYVANVKAMKKQLEAKFKELQAGVKERIDRGDSKSSIMEYLKAGFFTALGVIAAVLVVDAVAAAIQDDGGNANANANANNANANNADVDADVGDFGGLELGGGGGKAKAKAKAAKAPRTTKRKC
jgi:hypothetical protein